MKTTRKLTQEELRETELKKRMREAVPGELIDLGDDEEESISFINR